MSIFTQYRTCKISSQKTINIVKLRPYSFPEGFVNISKNSCLARTFYKLYTVKLRIGASKRAEYQNCANGRERASSTTVPETEIVEQVKGITPN